MSRDAEVAEIYSAIGEFAVAFESITHEEMRCILWLLTNLGLKDQNVIQILLVGHSAESMRVLLQSLISQVRPKNPEEEEIISDVLDRHQKLISERNDILHGHWYIGWGNEETTDWRTARGFKLGKNKSGPTLKTLEYEIEGFKQLTAEAKTLASCIYTFSGCFACNDLDLVKQFHMDEHGARLRSAV